MPEDPAVGLLSEDDQTWIDARLLDAAELGAVPTDVTSVGRVFDQGVESVSAGRADPDVGNVVVTLVGVTLGEHLCTTLGLRWSLYRDDQGSDLCVVLPGTSLVLFPLSSAAKRWESGETGWVEPFARWAGERVAELRDEVRGP